MLVTSRLARFGYRLRFHLSMGVNLEVKIPEKYQGDVAKLDTILRD